MIKICENTLEGVTISLYSDGNENRHQTLEMSCGKRTETTGVIAPVDFFTISSAIMCNKTLTGFVEDIIGTWCETVLKDMVEFIKR